MAYLSDLVGAMIGIDSKRTFSGEIVLSGLIRSTPVLEAETTIQFQQRQRNPWMLT